MHSLAIRTQALELIATGLNDCEVARRTGISRTTIRDWRRPPHRKTCERTPIPRTTCPRCWQRSRPMRFDVRDYAELLGLYLGDGHIVRFARTWRFRLFLDSRYEEILQESIALLERCFKHNRVSQVLAHEGRMTVLNVYSSHLCCLFPQHGPGKKHDRAILLEAWQQTTIDEAPWNFLRGCIRSDGCTYINRTGPYEYLSYGFSNRSTDILDLFAQTCRAVGVEYRRYATEIRVYRRPSVALLEANVGVKR